MEKNKDIAQQFYDAFIQKDGMTMAACYHDQVIFEDPAFGELHGKDAGDMWNMLCANATDLRISYEVLSATPHETTVKWQAWYTFSQTGKPVHNIVTASMQFKDGKIVDHRDHFDLHRWAIQAMGWKGWMIGGMPFFRKKLQQQTHRLLLSYQQKQHK